MSDKRRKNGVAVTVRGVRAPARVAATVAVLVAAAVLTACSNHSGLRRLHPSDSAASAVALPSGLAGSASASGSVSRTASRSPSHSPSPSHSHSPSPTPTSDVPSTSAAASHGTSRHSSSPTHSHPHSTTPAPPRSPAPPAPAVGVSPGSGLHGGQQVTVSGAHFAAGERVGVQQCRTSLSACVGLTSRSATVGGDGTFRTSFIVSSTVQLSSCHANGCVLRVRRADGDVFVVPIAFG